MMAKLVDIRQSVAPFDKSKAVGKRRLAMKKINGKINTLSDNAAKIQSVAVEVAQAIAQARQEDAQVKQQIQNGDASIPKEATVGKRYLVDLLCSKVIVRVQAEGFNG